MNMKKKSETTLLVRNWYERIPKRREINTENYGRSSRRSAVQIKYSSQEETETEKAQKEGTD